MKSGTSANEAAFSFPQLPEGVSLASDKGPLHTSRGSMKTDLSPGPPAQATSAQPALPCGVCHLQGLSQPPPPATAVCLWSRAGADVPGHVIQKPARQGELNASPNSQFGASPLIPSESVLQGQGGDSTHVTPRVACGSAALCWESGRLHTVNPSPLQWLPSLRWGIVLQHPQLLAGLLESLLSSLTVSIPWRCATDQSHVLPQARQQGL